MLLIQYFATAHCRLSKPLFGSGPNGIADRYVGYTTSMPTKMIGSAEPRLWLGRAMLTSPPIPPRVPARKRTCGCYELTGKALLDEAGKGWNLVHGVGRGVRGGRRPIGHAWLERNGWAYDVVHDELLSAEEQARKYGARPLLVLSRRDAARRIAAEGNWGPWGDSLPREVSTQPTR